MAELIENERFIIDSDEKANWALRKIRQLKAQQKEKALFACDQIREIQKEIQVIKDWEAKAREETQKDIDFFEGHLQGYAMGLKEKNPDLKTHKLPFGQLKFRKPKDEWVYNDETLLKAVKEAGLTDIIITEQRVNKNELKKVVSVNNGRIFDKNTGELILGVTVEDAPEKFIVNTTEVE